MAKRLTDCNKWTGNKWFRKLPTKYKLFWLFLLDTCDSVGVWEEDVELASFLISETLDREKLLEVFSEQIDIIKNGKKWWIKDFIPFQYGALDEKNTNNRPQQSYIKLLKEHSLLIHYKNSIDTPKDKDIDKDIEKDKDKDKNLKKEKANHLEFVYLLKTEYEKLVNKLGDKKTGEYIERLNNYIGQIGVGAAAKKYKSHYHVILNWLNKDKGGEVGTGSITPTPKVYICKVCGHKTTKLFSIDGKDGYCDKCYENKKKQLSSYRGSKEGQESMKALIGKVVGAEHKQLTGGGK